MNSIHKWIKYVVIPKFHHVFNFSRHFVFLNFIHILLNQVVVEVSAQFLIVIVALRDHHLSSMLWKKHWRILATRGSFKIIYSSSFLLIEYLSIKVGRLFCLIVMLRFLKPRQPYHPLGIVEKSWVNRSALRWFHDV
jgi:hypothetical protein